MLYSQDIIDKVSDANDIVDIIGEYVHLVKKGANSFGLCPFHSEKSPSFCVNHAKQMYYCFGCHKGGNVFTFLMEYENETFPEAVEALAARANIKLPERTESWEPRVDKSKNEKLLAVQKNAAIAFHNALYSPIGADALKYLHDRGLTDQTINAFGLGYAWPENPNASLYAMLKKHGAEDPILLESGLFNVNREFARNKFEGRVIFPIMDSNSKVVGFGGRYMNEAVLKDKTRGIPKYLNSPETPIFEKSRNLYGLFRARKSREGYLLLCEGYMDVLALQQAGFTNAVAALGTSFTENHCMLLRRYTKTVIMTFDSDSAGINAALRAGPMLRRAGLNAKVIQIPGSKDPDEFIKANGADAYRELIKKAENSFLFEIRQAYQAANLEDVNERLSFYNHAAQMLTEFTDSMTLREYLKEVSTKYKIEEKLLAEKVEYYRTKGSSQPSRFKHNEPKSTSSVPKERTDGLMEAQRQLLAWFIRYPNLYDHVKDFLSPDEFDNETIRLIASDLLEMLSQADFNPKTFSVKYADDPVKAQETARIMNISLSDDYKTPEDIRRSFRESLIRVVDNSYQKRADKAMQDNDIQTLQNMFTKSHALKNLQLNFEIPIPTE